MLVDMQGMLVICRLSFTFLYRMCGLIKAPRRGYACDTHNSMIRSDGRCARCLYEKVRLSPCTCRSAVDMQGMLVIRACNLNLHVLVSYVWSSDGFTHIVSKDVPNFSFPSCFSSVVTLCAGCYCGHCV